MKTIKHIFSFLVIMLVASKGYTQISGGAQLGYLGLLGDYGSYSSAGLGIKGEFARDEKTVITGEFNYFFGSSDKFEATANALSSSTSPSSITVSQENKISFMHFCVGGKRYFAGDYEDDFGIYGILQVGLMFVPVSTTVADYDRNSYAGPESQSETLTNFTIGGGVGAEKKLSFGYIFADFKLNVPANNVNGQQVSISIPLSYTLNAGVRIPITQ